MYDKRSKLKELHSFTKREIWKGFLLFCAYLEETPSSTVVMAKEKTTQFTQTATRHRSSSERWAEWAAVNALFSKISQNVHCEV